MQENRARTHDPVMAYLAVCGVFSPVSDDPVLQDHVRDLLSFYGSDVTGEHTPPTSPFMLDRSDEDSEDFVGGDAEEREQILECRIIVRFNELFSRH